MKNIQTIILCLGFLAFATTSAFAQDHIVTVHAQVLDQAEVQNIADVDFDVILPNGTAKIDPTGTNTGVSGDATHGEVSFTPPSLIGGLLSAYSVSWDNTVTLTSDDAANTMTYTPAVYGGAEQSNPSSASLLTNGGNLELGGVLTGGDTFYLFVGGTIGPLTDQPVGDYNGTLTITINSISL